MYTSMKGKRALVTGAGKGIGRDIVKALHKEGVKVVAVSRSQSDLDALKVECPGMEVFAQDLSNWESTQEAISKLGHFDYLVNNAGVTRVRPFFELKKEDLHFVFDTNFHSVFSVSQVVAKGMVEKGSGGSIVNISSTASMVGIKEHGAYCPSKAAVDSLTKVMALELGPHKSWPRVHEELSLAYRETPGKGDPALLLSLLIRVNSVNPTVVLTDMGRLAWSDPKKADPVLSRIPLGKFVEIEDVTNMVLFLLSDQAAMVNGTHMTLDGGLTCN